MGIVNLEYKLFLYYKIYKGGKLINSIINEYMKKKAIISVRSFNDLDEKDVIEVITPGEFLVSDEGYKAIYEETEISGMGGTTTTLTMLDDKFILEREGNVTTKMDFKKGETSILLYNTPYGAIDMQLYTKDLKVDISEDGGNIEAEYSMELSGQAPIKTKLSVNVKIN